MSAVIKASVRIYYHCWYLSLLKYLNLSIKSGLLPSEGLSVSLTSSWQCTAVVSPVNGTSSIVWTTLSLSITVSKTNTMRELSQLMMFSLEYRKLSSLIAHQTQTISIYSYSLRSITLYSLLLSTLQHSISKALLPGCYSISNLSSTYSRTPHSLKSIPINPSFPTSISQIKASMMMCL